jgi:hypothetical protein
LQSCRSTNQKFIDDPFLLNVGFRPWPPRQLLSIVRRRMAFFEPACCKSHFHRGFFKTQFSQPASTAFFD